MTPEQQKALALARARMRVKQKKPTTGVDVAKSFGSGVAAGAADLVGLPGTIHSAAQAAGDWLFGGPPQEIKDQLISGNPFSGSNIRGAIDHLTGGATSYEPQTTAGEFARTTGEFLPGAAAFGGGGAANILRYGVLPAVASEGAGQLTEGTAVEPYARIGAALLAPAIPSLASKVITPFGVPADRQAMANALRAEGVKPTAGQVTGNKALQFREAELGGMSAARVLEQQGDDFTRAALKRAGIDANRASPEVMRDGLKAIGDKFDDLAAQTTIKWDNQLQTDLVADVANYVNNATQTAPVVKKMATRVAEIASNNGRTIPGEAYKTLRSDIGKAAQAASDNSTRFALRDIMESLDDAVARSMPGDTLPKWQAVRKEYRNFLTLERAAVGAGEDAALGIISPARLRNATVQTQGRRNYVTGKGDFDELARSGQALMTPLPNSGTPARLNARTIGGFGAVLGAGAGSAGGIPGAMVGAAAGSIAPWAAGKALMSRPVQAYLMNNLVTPAATSARQYAPIVEALIAQEANRSGIGGR